MPLVITDASHLDHALTDDHIAFIRQTFGDRDGFFLVTVDMPEGLADLPCGLHGPIMGDEPVPEDETRREHRGGRTWTSRLTDRVPRPDRRLTVIAGPHGEDNCVLYTAFGGPVALQEPGDPGCKDVAASTEFWSQHAISAS